MNKRYYSGIGSRQTPVEIQNQMSQIAAMLFEGGFTLRSGHADGADQAFQRGAYEAGGIKALEVYLPWIGFNNTPMTIEPPVICPLGHAKEEEYKAIAAKYHPNWGVCNPAAKLLLTRNVPIILGENLDAKAEFVISWTSRGQQVGGTAHAMSIAKGYGIEIFNLGAPDGLARLLAFGEKL